MEIEIDNINYNAKDVIQTMIMMKLSIAHQTPAKNTNFEKI